MKQIESYWRLLLFVALAIPFAIGCQDGPTKPDTFAVSGKVTYKGKPVEGATVVLVADSADGQGAVANTDADGNYSVGTFGDADGAVAGSYKVKVFKYELVSEPPNDGDDMTEEEEEEEYTGEEDTDDGGGNLLPAKYENPAKSGFEVSVVDKAVTLNLDLK